MEVTLTETQKHVDNAIDERISRISRAERLKANTLPNGKLRKKYKPYTLPQAVDDLLALRQRLYNGEDPEAIMATITNGEIQETFITSK